MFKIYFYKFELFQVLDQIYFELELGSVLGSNFLEFESLMARISTIGLLGSSLFCQIY